MWRFGGMLLNERGGVIPEFCGRCPHRIFFARRILSATGYPQRLLQPMKRFLEVLDMKFAMPQSLSFLVSATQICAALPNNIVSVCTANENKIPVAMLRCAGDTKIKVKILG